MAILTPSAFVLTENSAIVGVPVNVCKPTHSTVKGHRLANLPVGKCPTNGTSTRSYNLSYISVMSSEYPRVTGLIKIEFC